MAEVNTHGLIAPAVLLPLSLAQAEQVLAVLKGGE